MNYNEGIMLVDKPLGFTSHDIVAIVRRNLNFSKVGHAGTLDPMATGLLIMLLGRFTKKSIYFSNYDKEYEATLRLGVATDSGDKEGKVTEEKDLGPFGEKIKNIEHAFKSFLGEIRQVPPMFSAKKVKGKKLYEFARKGITLKREPKLIVIKDIVILDISLPHVTFRVKCSKGTYVRQLGHDMGEKIGCGAHLVSLRRTKIGPFSVKDALSLDELRSPAGSRNTRIHENILQLK
ncbi:MAG: tRNA pseudouridine(55) synthase TruB [Omnitrophica bacterium]|nr:tRNA pseudouridine(55) synthase TruB [Candidatus Omnitrophota bacterium]